MKERPILFSAPMVRAILEGRKTQTRRVVKSNWDAKDDDNWPMVMDEDGLWFRQACPYGQIGDRLWVREAFFIDEGKGSVRYRASGHVSPFGWKPSIHMPRWASRILLEITSVRVERLQDISEVDALAEGITESQIDTELKAAEEMDQVEPNPARCCFRYLWEDINGIESWADNPWVWVVEFKKVEV